MTGKVDLYETSYGHFAEDVLAAIRIDTYGEDLGQSGWMTADELRSFIEKLALTPSSRVLDIGSGSGGPSLFVARTTGCDITGIDLNESGIANANRLALLQGIESRVRFRRVDASGPLPFPSMSFDAVFSNDTLCHVPNRQGLLCECYRVLRPGARLLFTDALVVTGIITHEEVAARSSIGHYLFAPPGANEDLMRNAGFELLQCEDLTPAASRIAERWHAAREKHRDLVVKIEGAQNFEGLQAFLHTVHVLCRERRLSRYAYLAQRPVK